MSLLREVIRVILKEHARDLEMEPDMSVAAVKFRDMPNKRWFVSPHHDMWYYHVPRRGSTHELDIHELSETLDPCLRDLALSLNARGCRTLPSCQGHYHTPERLSRAYDALLFDASQIRDMGLELRDVETGEVVVFSDPGWDLPWTRERYMEIANGTDGKPEGYLAFVTNDPKMGQRVSAASRIEGVRCIRRPAQGGTEYEIRVYTGDPHTQCSAWARVESALLEDS